MRLVINPHDDVSLRRVINVPARGHRQGRDGGGRAVRSARRDRHADSRTCRCLPPACSRRWRPTRSGSRLVRGLERARVHRPRRPRRSRVFRDLIVELTDIARQEPRVDRDRQDAGPERLPAGPARRSQRGGRGADREPGRARLGRARVRGPRAGAVARRLRRSAVAAVRRRRGAGHAATRASG